MIKINFRSVFLLVVGNPLMFLAPPNDGGSVFSVFMVSTFKNPFDALFLAI